MAKCVAKKPAWLNAPQVVDVYSVSGCTSQDFADYIPYWKHNGFWLFDSPDVIEKVAVEARVRLDHTTLFYYEMFESEFDGKNWCSFVPEAAIVTNIVLPAVKEFVGVDVVTFFGRAAPECSPLSCNSLAHEFPTNEHCLFRSLEEAWAHLENGAFERSAP